VLVAVTGRRRGEVADIEISVTDTGCGVPPDKLDAIFSAFEQADGSAARRHDGAGLGLAISRRLVEAMGGGISAQSEVGRGSTFRVRLTLRIDEEVGEDLPADPDRLTGARILIVDDNAVNRDILMEQLSAWGVAAKSATNGREALKMLLEAANDKSPYDLAIVDQQMPGMDGLVGRGQGGQRGAGLAHHAQHLERRVQPVADVGVALAEAIRQETCVSLTPLVLLTSAGRKGDPEGLKDGLFDAYLVKPARAARLLETVAAGLQGRAIQKAAAAARIAAPAKKHSRLVSADGAPLVVLVAEDNIVNQLVIRSMLENFGCRIEIAADGREAVRLWREKRPDIVLMDMSMPEMDGAEATARIRAAEQEAGGATPIIGVTAHAMKEDREKCLQAGMDDYLAKPVKQQPLYEALMRWSRPDAKPGAREAG